MGCSLLKLATKNNIIESEEKTCQSSSAVYLACGWVHFKTLFDDANATISGNLPTWWEGEKIGYTTLKVDGFTRGNGYGSGKGHTTTLWCTLLTWIYVCFKSQNTFLVCAVKAHYSVCVIKVCERIVCRPRLMSTCSELKLNCACWTLDIFLQARTVKISLNLSPL